MANIPKIPFQFREKIRFLNKKLGPKKFFLELLKIDPSAKKYINPFDNQRSIRAYEIKAFTKKSLFNWVKNTKSNYDHKDFFKIYIDFPKNDLLKKIEQRSKLMIRRGAVQEVKKLIKLKILRDKSANKAIGVNEIKEYIDKKIEMTDVVEKISIKTRQYAKRQRTWGRGNMTDWNKIKPNDLNKFLKKI